MSNVVIDPAKKSEILLLCDIRIALTVGPGAQGSFSPARAVRARIRPAFRVFGVFRGFQICENLRNLRTKPSKSQNQNFRTYLKLLLFRLNNTLFFCFVISILTKTICENPLSKHSRLMGRQLMRNKSFQTRLIKLYTTGKETKGGRRAGRRE